MTTLRLRSERVCENDYRPAARLAPVRLVVRRQPQHQGDHGEVFAREPAMPALLSRL